jgi:putative tricarboxylic transport membrane protein
MGNFELYIIGWQVIDWQILLFIFLGTALGILIGALPGLSVIMAVSIIVPLTYRMSPVASILTLVGIYVGGNYGGAITASLINIPGTPSAIMTALDGHPISRRGKAGLAIGTATLASVVGGIVSVFALALFSPALANVATRFTSLEIAGVAMFGLSVIAYVSPGSTIKGVVVGLAGLLLATVGFDPNTGIARFTFGNRNLFGGIDFVPAMIGLFGMAEMLLAIEKTKQERELTVLRGKVSKTKDAFIYALKLKWVFIRSSIVGVIIGIIPGAGGTIAAIAAYGIQKKVSRHAHLMGKGSLEGVAAPEAANNACIGGAFIPLLSLGIPGDAVTAVLIGAFIIHGIVPGPMLYTTNPSIVSAIFIGMMLANLVVLIVGITCANHIARILKVPSQLLNAMIIALCVIGTFAVKNSLFDTALMLVFGIAGYFMSKGGVPKAPLVLGLVLGPIIEENLRRWAMLSEGNYGRAFMNSVLTNPVTLTMTLATVVILALPLFSRKKHLAEDSVKEYTSCDSDFDVNEIIFADKSKGVKYDSAQSN